jgi:hypothetical protein
MNCTQTVCPQCLVGILHCNYEVNEEDVTIDFACSKCGAIFALDVD